MNIKIISFILIIIGLILIFIATPKIMESIPFLKTISPKYLIIPGIIAVGIGIILMTTGSEGKGKNIYGHKTKMGEEVPIFHEKEIVGYRIKK